MAASHFLPQEGRWLGLELRESAIEEHRQYLAKRISMFIWALGLVHYVLHDWEAIPLFTEDLPASSILLSTCSILLHCLVGIAVCRFAYTTDLCIGRHSLYFMYFMYGGVAPLVNTCYDFRDGSPVPMVACRRAMFVISCGIVQLLLFGQISPKLISLCLPGSVIYFAGAAWSYLVRGTVATQVAAIEDASMTHVSIAIVMQIASTLASLVLWHALGLKKLRGTPPCRVQPSAKDESEPDQENGTIEHASSLRSHTSIGKSFFQCENSKHEGPGNAKFCNVVPSANLADEIDETLGDSQQKTAFAADIEAPKSDGTFPDEDVAIEREVLSQDNAEDNECVEILTLIERNAVVFGAADCENRAASSQTPMSASDCADENQSEADSDGPRDRIKNNLRAKKETMNEKMHKESNVATPTRMRQAHAGSNVPVQDSSQQSDISDRLEVGTMGDNKVRIWSGGGDVLLELDFEEAEATTMAEIKQRLSADLGVPFADLVLTCGTEINLSENRAVRPLRYLRSFDMWLLIDPKRHAMQLTTPTRFLDTDNGGAVDPLALPTRSCNPDADIEDCFDERNTFDEEGFERDTNAAEGSDRDTNAS